MQEESRRLNGLPATYVGRPTKWGNPFVGLMIKGVFDRTAGDKYYRPYIIDCYGTEHIQRELRGKNLACWCPDDQPCHADILLELANKPKGD